jgi:hypothetical protein
VVSNVFFIHLVLASGQTSKKIYLCKRGGV